MSYANFIPTIWNESIDRDLERITVFAEDCNRKYEGKISSKGEAVKILGVGKPTIQSLVKSERNNDINAPEEVEDTSVMLYINKIAYFNYMVGDIDKAQAVDGVMNALQEETSEGLANEVDRYIANLAKDSNAIKLDPSAAIVDKDNILATLDRAIQKLYENDVKPTTKIVATVSPRFFTLLKRAYSALDTNNSDMLKHGKVGMYGNVTIKMSNNVAKSDDGNTDFIMMRTQRAIAYAKPLTHTEAYRPERKFADAVKGYILFDAKIVRPKEMVVLNVTY